MLVMTPPVPQSLSLLDSSLIPLPLEVRFSLEQIEYHRCLAILALLEKPSNIPPPGGISLEHNSLVWLGDNHQKGISPEGYAVTLHATPKFSDEYWDSDDAEIAYKLFTAAADCLDSHVIKYQVHRWRYSLPKTFYNEPCLALLELPLVMAGDAFVAPTIEGAVISGMAAGKSIVQRFRGSG
jgi:predicted NAD/FAD-dependent oxidoreductase